MPFNPTTVSYLKLTEQLWRKVGIKSGAVLGECGLVLSKSGIGFGQALGRS